MKRRAEAPDFGLRLVRNTALWALVACLVWILLTPIYNRFLTVAGENLLHVFESPDVTRLVREDQHYALITRIDFPPSRQVVSSFRLTDLHFHFILLVGLFLGTPETPWRKKLGDLGLALVAAAFFHLVLIAFWVQFNYATQLGDWSLQNYGPFARNFWGLGKHVLDLPVKLAFPLVLWAGFYIDRLLPPERAEDGAD